MPLQGALLTVLTSAVFCGPLVTFSSVLVRDLFHGGAARFSSAVAAFGVGGLLGAGLLLSIKASVDRRRLSAGAAILYGATLIVSAINPWFWGLPVLFVLAGAAMTITNTAANTLLQLNASPHQLGRTVSLYMLALRGGSSIGALITGASIGALGVQWALILNGAAAIVLQTAVAIRWFRGPLTQRSGGIALG